MEALTLKINQMGLKTKSHNKADKGIEEDKKIPLYAPIKAVEVFKLFYIIDFTTKLRISYACKMLKTEDLMWLFYRDNDLCKYF